MGQREERKKEDRKRRKSQCFHKEAITQSDELALRMSFPRVTALRIQTMVYKYPPPWTCFGTPVPFGVSKSDDTAHKQVRAKNSCRTLLL